MKHSLNAAAKIVLFDGPSNLGNIHKATNFGSFGTLLRLNINILIVLKNKTDIVSI